MQADVRAISRVLVNCWWCDGIIEAIPFRVEKNKRDFCSRPCYHEWRDFVAKPQSRVRKFRLMNCLVVPITTTRFEKFLQKMPTGSPDECWIWPGPFNMNGYGRFGA